MNDDDLPEIVVQAEQEEGFVDLDLRLVRLEARPNGTFLGEGRGRHNGRTLGFALEFNAEWKTTPIGDSDDCFYWGSGAVRSIGLESDGLLATLAELYEMTIDVGPMRTETRVAIVGLANDPRLMLETPTHMKLFFENEEPNRYAEVFVNVIATERRIQLHEKNPEYQRPLLRALDERAG
jgi:hypothetical protein